jgi:ABC-type glycerol-3-phosphate transport system substrate-binding protein
VEQFLQLGRDNQRLVALPFVANAQVFFRDERYVPTPPATWDDALRQAAGIEKKYHIPGFAIRGAFGNSLTADFLPLLWVHGGTIDPERGQFTLGPAVKALDLMKRMATQAAPGFLGFGTAEVRSQLKTGQAAMGVGWLSSVVALEANFAYSGLPGLNKSEREGQSAFSTWLLAIPKQSKRKDDTVKLLDELMKKDVLEAVSKQSIPVLKSLTGKVGYRLPGCSRARPRGKRSTDIATKFSFAISQVLTGATPKEAMCNLQREIGKLTIAPSVGRQ